VAYEAATADISDCNQIDPFHLEAYGTASVNYNRDVEVFPVLRRILERISGTQSVYRSPTDMGVNKVGFAIIDDMVVREASAQEIIRRFLRYRCERVMGFVDDDTVQRVELLMRELDISPDQRKVIAAAHEEARLERECLAGSDGTVVAAALELADGTFITGHNSPLLHAASSLIINAIKHLAGIPKQLHLLPKNITESVTGFKTGILNMKSASLDLEETLIALCISAMSNPAAQLSLDRLPELRGCEMHSTHIPTRGDEEGLRRLGVNVTSDAVFSSKNLFIQ